MLNITEYSYINMIDQLQLEQELFEGTILERYSKLNDNFVCEGFVDKLIGMIVKILDKIIDFLQKIRSLLSKKWKEEVKKHNDKMKSMTTNVGFPMNENLFKSMNIYKIDLNKYNVLEYNFIEYPEKKDIEKTLSTLLNESPQMLEEVFDIYDNENNIPDGYTHLEMLNKKIYGDLQPNMYKNNLDYIYIIRNFLSDKFHRVILNSKDLHVFIKDTLDKSYKNRIKLNSYEILYKMSIRKQKTNKFMNIDTQYSDKILEEKNHICNLIDDSLKKNQAKFGLFRKRFTSQKETKSKRVYNLCATFLTKYLNFTKDLDVTYEVTDYYQRLIDDCDNHLEILSNIFNKEVSEYEKETVK